MRTSLHSKYVRNLTAAEFKEVDKKNFGRDGYMRDDLRAAYKRTDEHAWSTARVLMIKGPDNRVIAWALIQPDRRKRASVMVWTVPKFRRQGYGARLLKHARKFDSRPKVYPHDSNSGMFFKSVGEVRVAPYDRFWMKA